MMGNILILSEPFGGGHTKVAEALKGTLEDWNCSVCELGNYLQPRLAPYVTKGYLKTVQKAPWLWGKIYSSTICESSVIPYLYRKVYFTKLAKLLLQTQPDLIIATHPLPASAISSLRKYKINIPLVGIVTDFHIHPSWSLTDWDYLCTPTVEIPGWLKQNTRLLPTGIPVRPDFYHINKGKERQQEVLWMGGSVGICKNMHWIRHLFADPTIRWTFVTGHNFKLFEQLQAEVGHLDHVRILGYVDDIAALMDTADLLITKPGGVTCSEAIQKELPILLVDGLTGQEEQNADFLLRSGMAAKTDSLEVWFAVKNLLDQPRRLEELQRGLRGYKQSIRPDLLPLLLEYLCRTEAAESKLG